MAVTGPSVVWINGRRLAYDEVRPLQPQGTILLLTGAESTRLAWSNQRDVFGRTYRTIALDYRDTGDSDLVSTPYTIADLAADAVAVLDAIDVQRAHVVGISLGGYVALQLAVGYPERVATLVLVATAATYVPPSPALLARLQQLQQDNQIEAGERMVRTLALLTAPGYLAHHAHERERMAAWTGGRPLRAAAAARQVQACLRYDLSGHLAQIRVPTLVVQGDRDPRVGVAHARFLAEHIRGARLLLYPHTGHLVIVERAAQFNHDVLAFLKEESGVTRAQGSVRWVGRSSDAPPTE